MKHFGRFCAALVAALVLTLPAAAGEIYTGFSPPPPAGGDIQYPRGDNRNGMAGHIETGAAGDMTTGTQGRALTPPAEAALGLLWGLLPLL